MENSSASDVRVEDEVQSIGFFGSSVAKAVTTSSAIGNVNAHRQDGARGKPSWICVLLNDARNSAAMRETLRARPK